MKTKFKETEIGVIPEDWEVKSIETVADVVGGGTPSTKNSEYWDGDIPWITPRDLSNFKFRYIAKGERSITKKGLEDSSAKLVPENTVLLTTRAPVGYLAISKNEVSTNQGFRSLIPKNGVKTEFLFYLLKNNVEILKSNSSGTTFGELSGSRLKSLQFAFPNISEQQKISKVLSDLDSKIELNQNMNKTFEAIGQAIFKHWFVNFEFPNDEGKPYRSSGGEMVYNEELGKEIPSNSRVINLGELIELDKGLSYKGAFLTNNENGLPMVNLGTFRPLGGFNDDQMKYYSGEFKERHLVKSGDLVIANTDITQNRVILGSPSLIPSYLNSQKILFTHHVYAVRNKNNLIKNEFLYYVLQSSEYRNRAKGFATGTTVLALPRDAILELPIILFDESILNNFDKLITNIIKKIETNYLQILNLSKTRDSLLPKLMSGKIRVPVEAN